MIEIKDLLTKFSNLLFSQEEEKRVIGNVISNILKIEIDSKDIEIKNGTIYLNIKPIYKNEIFLKRDKIFLELEKNLKKVPQNIR